MGGHMVPRWNIRDATAPLPNTSWCGAQLGTGKTIPGPTTICRLGLYTTCFWKWMYLQFHHPISLHGVNREHLLDFHLFHFTLLYVKRLILCIRNSRSAVMGGHTVPKWNMGEATAPLPRTSWHIRQLGTGKTIPASNHHLLLRVIHNMFLISL
jgi:hypothetical protein